MPILGDMRVTSPTGRWPVPVTLDFAIWVEKDADADATTVNAALVNNYYTQLRAISEQYGIPEPQDWFLTLLRMPDVTSKTEAETLTDEEWDVVRGAVDDAITHLGHCNGIKRQAGCDLEQATHQDRPLGLFGHEDLCNKGRQMQGMGNHKLP